MQRQDDAMKLVFSPKAAADLEEIGDSIRPDNLD
jgi:hypothetical protein